MPQDVLNNIAAQIGDQALSAPQTTPSETPHIDAALAKQQGGESDPPAAGVEQPPAAGDAEPEKKGEDPIKDIAESTGYTMDALSSEWYEKGELPQDAYASLEKAGFPREFVDEVCKGVAANAKQEATQQIVAFQSAIAAHVGGQETLEKLLAYTDSPNFDPAVRAEIDSLINIDNPAAAKLAMEKVKHMYEKEYGKDGNPIGGTKSTGSAGDVFKTRAEQSKAFISARNSGDKSLMAQVREKAARTSQHNRKSGVNWL